MIPTIHDVSLALYVAALWRKAERDLETAAEKAGTVPKRRTPYNGAESKSTCGGPSLPSEENRIEPQKNRKKRTGDAKRNHKAA